LLYGFNKRRPRQRPLSRFGPEGRGLFDQPGFGAMTCQQFGLVFRNVGETAFKSFGDASMKRTSRLAQQCAVGCILHKCVLEKITC
jgi:hypothetical protein